MISLCRGMEVAAVVSAMSPAISPTLDSLEVINYLKTKFSGNDWLIYLFIG